jgi:pyruvate dehydrogenase (quinone)
MGKLVADIIVETLQSAGVKHCYGVVGDTLNLIARSLEKSEIEWISMRHEEAGAFAAQAEAQLADRLTAVAGSCGPGSLHFINGNLRGQSQPCARHPDRKSDHSRRTGL